MCNFHSVRNKLGTKKIPCDHRSVCEEFSVKHWVSSSWITKQMLFIFLQRGMALGISHPFHILITSQAVQHTTELSSTALLVLVSTVQVLLGVTEQMNKCSEFTRVWNPHQVITEKSEILRCSMEQSKGITTEETEVKCWLCLVGRLKTERNTALMKLCISRNYFQAALPLEDETGSLTILLFQVAAFWLSHWSLTSSLLTERRVWAEAGSGSFPSEAQLGITGGTTSILMYPKWDSTPMLLHFGYWTIKMLSYTQFRKA